MHETKRANIIHYIIVAAFCLLFRFVPGFAGITPLGMGLLGTFIGAVYGWITIDMLWPSIMALLGAGLSLGMTTMLTASFGTETVVCLILCMMAVGLAMSTGAFNWLAAKMLNSKMLEGKAYLTIFIILILAWLFGNANPIIMCVIFCGFLTSMFQQVGVEKDDPLVVFTFLGVAYNLMRGQILFPFMSTGLVYLNMFRNMFKGMDMPVTQYMTMMITMGILMTVVYVALMKFVFRIDASKLANYKVDGGVQPATKEQKIALVLFLAFIGLNVLSVIGLGSVSAFLKKFGIVGIAIAVGSLVPLLSDSNGKPLGDLEKLLHMCNWGQVTMVGYIMLLSTYFTGQDTGIRQAMGYVFQPFTGLPPIVFVVVVMIIATVLTNIANNMIVTVVCMPFLVSYASQIGMSPVGMVALLFIISEFALATPAASPVTAVAMSQEMITTGSMTKAAMKVLPFLFVIFMLVAWPLSMVIFPAA